jgi:hypothetical protein
MTIFTENNKKKGSKGKGHQQLGSWANFAHLLTYGVTFFLGGYLWGRVLRYNHIN